MPYLNFQIDKLTNCLEEKETGLVYNTTLSRLTSQEVKGVLKKDGWQFNWKTEFKLSHHQIYKLQILGNPQIQGLISFQPMVEQQYIELHLIENAPHNFGSKKRYIGVAGNLVAFACKMSFEMGFDGCVGFTAKSRLIQHYSDTLGAKPLLPRNRMGIYPPEAKFLVNSYYKNYFHD